VNQVRGPLDEEPQEPGWWLASDRKWYPPETRTGVAGSGEGQRSPSLSPRYCVACGSSLSPSAIFCPSCGTGVGSGVQSHAPGSPQVATTTAQTSRTDAYLLLAAAALVVAGSFLPWVKATAVLVGTITRSGTEGGDGWWSILLAVPLAIFAIRRLSASHAQIPGLVALLFSAILGVLTVYEIADVSNKVSDVNDVAAGLARAEIGVGLWMLLIGTALAVIGSLIALSNRRH
jgi:hypothetical protein